MKWTLLAIFCLASFPLSLPAADEPLIPTPLNEVLSCIKPGMTAAEAKAQIARSYPKVQASLGEWDGMTGYVDCRLDDRYSVSFSAHNPPSGAPTENNAILGKNLRIYIFDHQQKMRLEISRYQWESQPDANPKTEQR